MSEMPRATTGVDHADGQTDDNEVEEVVHEITLGSGRAFSQ